ncbi:12974_t:CDS:2 [Funneliformis caledonium]|uniref:12974_t:CDS:1 n=1 Tax=Funneliformis caledonium TaxID=1117310 RepID=A0A9N9B3Y9_9GLOM|nr:12974_t:CDS:2 [Funneliformis caledonium]
MIITSFGKLDNVKKTKIPEYFILAGTAQELPRLLIECADSLKDALVFNLSFENGTKLIRGDEIMSSKAICNRIFFQLLKQPNDSWNDFKNRYNVTLEDVLRRIAKYRTQEVKDLNMTLEVMDALEALGETVVDKDIDLINNVRLNLTYNYSGWLTKTAYLRPILRIILAHTSVNKDQTIFELDGQKINVDDVIQYRLVRFESSDPDRVVGYLSCPYIWLWIMAHAYHENINDPLLRSWDFAYYNEVLSESGEPNIPPGCQYWQQHFEYFVAQIRSLKSNIYNYDKRVDLSVIHNGATHNFGQVSISNRQLTLSKSVERFSTRSKDYRNQNEIYCRLNYYKRRHISSKLLREQSISQKIFEEEYNNTTSSGDIFIFYTSASCQKLDLQPMSAIVNKENWKEYFGPFAGRCYNYAMGPPDINKATFTQLSGIEKIAKNVLGLSWKNEMLYTKCLVNSHEIFEYLNYETDLRLCLLVNRQWCELEFYSSLFIPNIPIITYPGAIDCLRNLSEFGCSSNIDSEIFYQMSQICHNLESLNLIFGKVISNGLTDLISVQKNLTYLYVLFENHDSWRVPPPLKALMML